MKYLSSALGLLALSLATACATNPYRLTNKSYQRQTRALTRTLRAQPPVIAGPGSLLWDPYWVGTTNFGLRKPNLVVIHHTAQHSTDETLKTFTLPRTQVSAHYVIGRDGRTFHMLNDYLRAWHGGIARWGNDNDINSSSVGIELDNDGIEPFTPMCEMSEPSGPIENGTTYIVRPFMQPLNSAGVPSAWPVCSSARISAGAFQWLVGPASS